MKKLSVFMMLLLSVMVFSGCSKVPSGHVGIKVYLLGNAKGADTEVLDVGRYWVGINEELHLFPTFQKNYVWTKSVEEGSPRDESITFQTAEGLECNADIGISYHIDPNKVSVIFQKYRKGIKEITDVFLRNIVRDSLVKISSTMPVETVYGKGKAQLIERAENMVRQELAETGIVIDSLYWIGSIRLPEKVVKALNDKIEATQRSQKKENELREEQAEAKKRVAKSQGEAEAILTVAKAKAQANTIISKSLTPTLIEYEKVQKWDGKLPTYTGNGQSFLQMKQ